MAVVAHGKLVACLPLHSVVTHDDVVVVEVDKRVDGRPSYEVTEYVAAEPAGIDDLVACLAFVVDACSNGTV